MLTFSPFILLLIVRVTEVLDFLTAFQGKGTGLRARKSLSLTSHIFTLLEFASCSGQTTAKDWKDLVSSFGSGSNNQQGGEAAVWFLQGALLPTVSGANTKTSPHVHSHYLV